MSRIGLYWTGLLKAGAVALVLALFGLSAAAAHDGAHHAGDGTATPTSFVSAPAHGDCHDMAGHGVTAAGQDHRRDHGTDGRCQDLCACGCLSACMTHMPAGLPAGSGPFVRAVSGLCLPPSRSDDPAGRHPPPDLRPPLST
ncbi:hypothetical protein [Niveispirillum fermenti]|uniref:hypothetical protein n=1 Tax=Niveispirillum fermenti TaxID=1233113 RepID=UPI003A8873F2